MEQINNEGSSIIKMDSQDYNKGDSPNVKMADRVFLMRSPMKNLLTSVEESKDPTQIELIPSSPPDRHEPQSPEKILPSYNQSATRSLIGDMQFVQDADNELSCERMVYAVSRAHPHVSRGSGKEVCEDRGVQTQVLRGRRNAPVLLGLRGDGVEVRKVRDWRGTVLQAGQVHGSPNPHRCPFRHTLACFVYDKYVCRKCLGNQHYPTELKITGINRKKSLRPTLGNLGMGGYACSNGLAGENVHLVCAYGVVHSLISTGYGSSASTCHTTVTLLEL